MFHVFHDDSEVVTLQMPWMIPPSLNSAAALAAQCRKTCGEMLHCYAYLPLPGFLLLIFSATGDVKLSRLFPADHLAVGKGSCPWKFGKRISEQGASKQHGSPLNGWVDKLNLCVAPDCDASAVSQLFSHVFTTSAKLPQSSRAALGVLITDTSFPEFAHLAFLSKGQKNHGDKTHTAVEKRTMPLT